MSHVKKDKLGKTKLCNEVEIYDTTRIFSSKEWIKNRNIPGVLKIIQNCPKCKKEAADQKRRKCGNINITHNISSTNYGITQTAIAEFHTSQVGENSIPVQVQIPRMRRQRGFNAVSTNNNVSVNV